MDFTYTEYLCEGADDGKLRHLEHPEDHMIHNGEKGFFHSVRTLDAVHNHLLSGKSDKHTNITTKYDGSPSVVFGHHPETGRFFVATKSAFSKTPKLNHTHADIDKNHEAPGLRQKLHTALTHLPKSTPKKGVFQGDLMYTHHDIANNAAEKEHHFKPNTITYSVGKHTDEGKKISRAKLGIVVHTHYKGNNLGDMKAHFDPPIHAFTQHKDVHIMHPKVEGHASHYSPEAQNAYMHHMRKAMAHHSAIKNHDVLAQHTEHLKTFINKSVVDGKRPSVDGYKKHVIAHHERAAEGVKSADAKGRHIAKGAVKAAQTDTHKSDFEHLFAAHHHIGEAKNQLVHALSSHSTYGHSIEGRPSKPEGFVVSHNGNPTKLVHRSDFSRANLSRTDRPGRAK
jgi:hypothetical protein